MLGNLRCQMKPGARKSQTGLGAGESLLYGLVGVLILLALFALVQSFNVQQRANAAFSGWYEDYAGYEQALTVQQQTGQPIMVYFYADWCPYCKRFKQNVLSDSKMQAFVQAHPHVRVAPDNGQREKDLMSDFEADGYPSYFVVLPDGRRFKVETYTEGDNPRPKTADEFIDSVRMVMAAEGQ